MATTQDIFTLARIVELRYQLDKYEAKVIEQMLPALISARSSTLKKIDAAMAGGDLFAASDPRLNAIINELSELVLASRVIVGDTANAAAEYAYIQSLEHHSNTLSVFGALPEFNSVQLSAEQLSAFWNVRVNDLAFGDWLTRSYRTPLIEMMREKIASGMFTGASYSEMRKEIVGLTSMAERNADTLVRTWVQTANVNAQKAVYDANVDIVGKVEWSAVLENGYQASGRGTCLRCAALDGRIWETESKTIPPIPLHPKCRCMLLPKTKTWRDLGLDLDEIEDKVRPYTIRPDKSRFGEAGVRTILKAGKSDLRYGEWIATQSKKVQIDALGEARYSLIKSGKISFDDLVKSDGTLKTLKELQ